MTDPASLAVSVIGLAALFKTSVECLEYIQLGRSFGHDFGRCILQVDIAKLRLYRWAESIGLGQGQNPSMAISVPKSEFDTAMRLLGDICNAFDDAQGLSERYEKRAKGTSTDLTVLNESEDLDARYQRVNKAMRTLVVQRQKGTSFLKKTKWALYEKKKFDGLIEEVKENINQLVELFPAAKVRQQTLCREEVATIREREDLEIIEDVSEQDDRMLHEATAQELRLRGHTASHWKAGDNAKIQVGDRNEFGEGGPGDYQEASNTATHFELSGSADVQIGNRNRFK